MTFFTRVLRVSKCVCSLNALSLYLRGIFNAQKIVGGKCREMVSDFQELAVEKGKHYMAGQIRAVWERVTGEAMTGLDLKGRVTFGRLRRTFPVEAPL